MAAGGLDSPQPATRDADAALLAWLQHLAHERRCSPRTLEAYGGAVRTFLAFLEQHQGERPTLASLGGVKAAELRAFLAFRRSGMRPLSPRSLSQSLSAIRTFYRWLDRRMGVANAEVALVRGPRVRPGVPRPVSPDVAQGLIKPFLFAIIISLVGCFYGLRTKGGTQGVGLATTQAVVVASVWIFVINFFVTQIFVNI